MAVIQLPVIKERIPAPYPKGRICKTTNCTQPLSQYNHMEICNACWLKGLPAEEREAA
jgi:hypothetical protein